MSLNRRGWVVAALALGGCATGPNHIYPGLVGQKVVGNEVSVSVSNVWSRGDAMPLADTHCHKYGKAARFIDFSGNTASFDCITP